VFIIKYEYLKKKEINYFYYIILNQVYSETAKSQFPVDLSKLSKTIIKLLQFPDEFMAEAAIVNFYHPSSTLSGHTDHSEYNLSAPLLSIR
jgi:alkylated DNA repair protein alkB homolog 1